MQAHELADAELAEACPFRWAERRFDEVPGVFPADELGICGAVVAAVHPDGAAAGGAHVARSVRLVAEGERDHDHVAVHVGRRGRHVGLPERLPTWWICAAMGKCRRPANLTMTGLRILVSGRITTRTNNAGPTG